LFMENGDKIFQKLSECVRENDVVLLESRVPHKLVDKLIKDV